jgi:Zn-dependent protease with chaperone function
LVPFLIVVGLVLAAGGVLAAFGVPLWVPIMVCVLLVAVQWAINPWLFEKLVPAQLVAVNDSNSGYVIDHPLGAIVARRCAEAGIGLVRLGIVDHGTPNACTFGHRRGDARLWVTRGLPARLDEAELDAVIAHEIGHIVNHDFVVMTVVSGLPVLAYWVVLSLGNSDSNNEAAGYVWLAAMATYLLSCLAVCSISRGRESGADRYSCRVTGNGDALCSALVKVGYGMGQVKAQRDAEIRRWKEAAAGADRAERQQLRRQAASARRQQKGAQALRVLGIADADRVRPIDGDAPDSPQAALAALRWEAVSPWAHLGELWASHPTVFHRIAALADSGLDGAPVMWADAARQAAMAVPEAVITRWRFAVELVVRYGGAAALVGFLYLPGDNAAVHLVCLAIAAVLVTLWAAWGRPLTGYRPIDRIVDLLGRLDVNPARTLPVSLRGQVIGRGQPGYQLSADLVLQDDSGFVPLHYRQPVPFARTRFALTKAGRFADQQVLVRGWYSRSHNGPIVELRDVVGADGTTTRCRQWIVRYLLAGGLMLLLISVLVVRLLRTG